MADTSFVQPSQRKQSFRPFILAALLLLACAGSYLVGNGRMALFDRDEPWYAQISRTMVQTGDWIVPRFRGEVFYGKPVLSFWCQAASMKVFGLSVFAARFPSVVFGMAVLLIVGWFVWRFLDATLALWTMFVLGTSVLFLGLAKLALMDAQLLLWITLAQICLAGIYSGRRRIWIAVVLWFATGLAILVKGPVVIGTLAATVFALALFDVGRNIFSFSAWRGATRWWWSTQPWLALLIIPLVAAPWAYMVHEKAPNFLRETLNQNMLGPIFKHGLNGRTWIPGYYLLAIWPAFMPWSLLLPPAAVNGWKNRNLAPLRFCLAATIGPLVVIELVKQKLPHYLLPLFPPLAFLTADLIVRCLQGRDNLFSSRGFKRATIIWALLILAAASAPWLLLLSFRHHLPYIDFAILTALGVLIGGFTAGLFIAGRARAALISMGVSMFVLASFIAGFLLPSFVQMNASRLSAQAMWDRGFKSGETVALFGYTEPSLTYYLDGQGVPFPADFLQTRPPDHWPDWIVMSSEVWNNLTPEQRRPLEEIGVFRALSTGATRGGGRIIVTHKRAL